MFKYKKADGTIVNVTEAKVQEFLLAYPDATIVEESIEPGKPTSQGQGAPVAGTAAPEVQAESTGSTLEDGSSDLQEISIQEKKKLPYAIRQQLTREQDFSIKRVNELTKNINKKNDINAVPPIVKEGKMLTKDLDRVSEERDNFERMLRSGDDTK